MGAFALPARALGLVKLGALPSVYLLSISLPRFPLPIPSWSSVFLLSPFTPRLGQAIHVRTLFLDFSYRRRTGLYVRAAYTCLLVSLYDFDFLLFLLSIFGSLTHDQFLSKEVFMIYVSVFVSLFFFASYGFFER